MNFEKIACVCHEANRGYQQAFPQPGIPVAPEWAAFKEEFPDQAAGVVEGVRKAVGGASPEELHKAWCDAKLDAGWRYGGVKDVALREHPNLLPYGRLPASERRKDALFRAVCVALSDV